MPQLIALDHVDGAGGFYADGVIAIGLADLKELADQLVSYFRPSRRLRQGDFSSLSHIG